MNDPVSADKLGTWASDMSKLMSRDNVTEMDVEELLQRNNLPSQQPSVIPHYASDL